MAHLTQTQAVKEYHELAAKYGVALDTGTVCYPPECKAHHHTDEERRAWVLFAGDLAARARQGHRPDRTEEERS